MVSFVLPLLLVGWAVISLWAAHRLGEGVAQRSAAGGLTRALRWEIKALALVALLPLPLIDELLAKPQFDALCREQTAVQMQAGLAPGHRVHLTVLPPEPVSGLTLPVSQRKHVVLSDDTRQTVLSYSSFEAHAGKLARLMGVTQAPLTFEGRCAPVNAHALLEAARRGSSAPSTREGGAPSL
jgi:hypothetical protein